MPKYVTFIVCISWFDEDQPDLPQSLKAVSLNLFLLQVYLEIRHGSLFPLVFLSFLLVYNSSQYLKADLCVIQSQLKNIVLRK